MGKTHLIKACTGAIVVPESDRESFVHEWLILTSYSFPGKLLQVGFVPDLPSDAPHCSPKLFTCYTSSQYKCFIIKRKNECMNE